MTINLDLMKRQMEQVDFNTYNMANYADVSYSVIHNLLSGKSELNKVSLKVYKSFESLFTPTELLKAADSYADPQEYDEWWMSLLKKALKSDDVKIDRSGAPDRVPREEGGYYQTLPVYSTVRWYCMNGKEQMSLRIWDQELYRQLDGKGQKDKKEIVETWTN